MEWRYAQRPGREKTTQAYQAPQIALMSQSPHTDIRTKLYEEIVPHSSFKDNAFTTRVGNREVRIQWGEQKQKWFKTKAQTPYGWLAQGREIGRPPEETWPISPELESLITEELGCTRQAHVTPWNALMSIPVTSWKHQEDIPKGWKGDEHRQ